MGGVGSTSQFVSTQERLVMQRSVPSKPKMALFLLLALGAER